MIEYPIPGNTLPDTIVTCNSDKMVRHIEY